MAETTTRAGLRGRKFYESIGSPRYIVAPMVDQSEFAWRMLTRSFMPSPSASSPPMLAYTPMFHARMFADTQKYRDHHFKALSTSLPAPAADAPAAEADLNLDGNPKIDRPLFVQFCANKADEFLAAAKLVAPYCDAVDLNLGCPQGIAKRGNYGAFLQEDWDTIKALISTLHASLSVPVTAKFRVQETHEKTLEYARMILDAGASIITVHGRQRHQKGHNTGLADWSAIRYLRDNLPSDTVIFANGNILQHADIDECLAATGADGVMSAEGNLYDPSIFAAAPPAGQEGREYYRSADGKGGWRMDAVLRRYLDILHEHVLKEALPERAPLYIYGDALPVPPPAPADEGRPDGPPPSKKQKRTEEAEGPPLTKKQKRVAAAAARAAHPPRYETNDANLTAVQAHLFHLLRPLVSKHTHIRDMLARTRTGDIARLERILSEVEAVVAQGIKDAAEGKADEHEAKPEEAGDEETHDPSQSSVEAVARCKRPWFVCQPYVRPLPAEALQKGALQLSKKDKRRLEEAAREKDAAPEAGVELVTPGTGDKVEAAAEGEKVEVPREGLVCG